MTTEMLNQARFQGMSIPLNRMSLEPPRLGDLVPTMPRCVCPKVKDMGPFSVSGE